MSLQAVVMPVPISRRLRQRARWAVEFSAEAHPEDRAEMARHALLVEQLADEVEALEEALRPRTAREQRRGFRRLLSAIGIIH